MIELNIRITGNTLLNDKVDELIKVAKQIQETEENLDTKMGVKTKKEKSQKEPKRQEDDDVEEIEEDIEDDEDIDIEEDDDEDISSVDDLRKSAKSLFIKLTKKDRPKAKALVEKYGVASFSELDELFDNSLEKWTKFIKILNKYVG